MPVKIVTALTVFLCLFAGVVYADGELGVGVIVGEPTGICAKKWLNNQNAIAVALAWSLSDRGWLQLHADYLFHNYEIAPPKELKGRLPLYFGVGARVTLNENARVGVRIPFGVSYIMSEVPFDLFAEIVPVLNIIPDTGFELNAAIGARFYFM